MNHGWILMGDRGIAHLFDESFYGTPTLITRIGTETGSLVEGTGLGPATPSK